MPRVHFYTRHRYVHYVLYARQWGNAGQGRESGSTGRTIDRVEDLAIGRTGAALLDLGIVNLEELVEPCKKFRA